MAASRSESSLRFPRIVLFGDSLTQDSFEEGGWGAAVAHAFVRKCDVLNRGFSGYTTAFNKEFLSRLLLAENNPPGSIVAATILLGSNDSVLYDFDQRGLEIEDYTDNLRIIIELFKKAGVPADRLILMTPPPVCEEMWRKRCKEKGVLMNMCSQRVKEFAHACVDIGQSQGVDVEDLHTSMSVVEDWTSFLRDGLHLSAKGNAFIAQQVVRLLHSKLDNLPMILPDWKQVDPNEPEKTLGKNLKIGKDGEILKE